MDQSAIGIVGSGVVAQAIGRLLRDAGQPVVAVAGRTPARVQQAASFVADSRGGVEAVAIGDLPRVAPRILIAVSDSGLAEVADLLAGAGVTPAVVLHTCGARGPDVLDPVRRLGAHGGVIHPLQTVVSPAQGLRDLQHIAFALAGDAKAVSWGRDIIAILSGRALAVPPDRMPTYHAGAVMASNVVTAVLDSAARLMTLAGIDYQDAIDAIGPLSRTSVDNAIRLGPRAALTGPIGRGDLETVRAHVHALAGTTDSIRELYRAAGFALLELARQRGGLENRLQEIAVVLNELERVS